MKILVCVKQVPDMESDFRVNAEGTGYDERGLVFRINRYDEFALEEAVRIKEASAERVELTALSVGPERAESVVRRGLEFGADRGVHIVTPSCDMDAIEVASLIASCANNNNIDLLFFGIMAEDDQRCLVGPMVAALLDVPCATTVVKETMSWDRRCIEVERELEEGRREILEMPLPAALTIQSGINTPRYPSLTNKLRAKKQAIEVINSSGLPQPRKSGQATRTCLPPPLKGGVILTGSIEEQAERLVRIIHEKTAVI